jgi:hypothetical protein
MSEACGLKGPPTLPLLKVYKSLFGGLHVMKHYMLHFFLSTPMREKGDVFFCDDFRICATRHPAAFHCDRLLLRCGALL